MVMIRSPTPFSLRKQTLLTSRPDRNIKLTRLKLLLGYHQHVVRVCLVILWYHVLNCLRKNKLYFNIDC